MSALDTASTVWSTIAAMGAVSALFILFGLLRLRSEPTCTSSAEGGGCASCGAVCHLHPEHQQRGENDHA
jgi:hypothetical protein